MFMCFCQLCNSWRFRPLLGPYPKAYTAPIFAAYGVPLADLIAGQCMPLVIGRQSHRNELELQHHSATIE